MKQEKRSKEPQIIVKPLGRFGGLDNLHITLAVVVVLLIALLLVISYSKPILVLPANNTTSALAPVHNATQVRAVVEQELASYGGVNGSLSLLPYISNVSSMKLGYSNSSHDWYATVSATNPVGNVAFNVSFIISDANMSVTPFL